MSNIMLQSLKFPGLDDTYLIPLIQNFAPVYDSTATYAVGDYCTHDNKFYKCTTAISTAEAWTVGHWNQVSVAEIATAIGADVDDLKEALTSVETTLPTKADKSGTVASAEQLLSDVGTEDKAPYLFRATPYDSTRVDEEVVGVSVGWNQLMNPANYPSTTTINGITFTKNADGSVSISGTADALAEFVLNAYVDIPKDHVAFMRGCPSNGSANTYYLVDNNQSTNKYDYGSGIIYKITTVSNRASIRIRVASGAVITTPVTFLPQFIDLTAWFGSTIADYAYTLETATPGSGVAFIKALLPGGYLAYSAPTLKSVSGLSGHKFVGFNQWDEKWENTYYNDSGVKTTNNNLIGSKNFIKVIPGATYYGRIPSAHSLTIAYFDSNKTFLSRTTGIENQTFVIPANCQYISISTSIYYGGTYKHDICINLSDPARNGQYEPYKATTYALDSDLTLRGILKMDSDHNVYADGDVYLGEGKKKERYAEVDLGSLNWEYNSQGYFVSSGLNDTLKRVSGGNTIPNAICSKYTVSYWNDATDKIITLAHSSIPTSTPFVWVHDTAYTDAASFKTAMSGVYLVYELATPTTETADPYASPQNCEPGGTEEYVYAEGGSGVPVGHNSRYQKNMRSELERVSDAVPDAPSVAGTYSLKATVTAQGVTYAWVSD